MLISINYILAEMRITYALRDTVYCK